MSKDQQTDQQVSPDPLRPSDVAKPAPMPTPAETGGPPGPEPTRYGDWERGGRCVDF